jgi:hypothetical protein
MEQSINKQQWKSYVGGSSGRTLAPATLSDLRPPRRVEHLKHCALNNQDVDGSRPRGDVPPGVPGGPRERRHRRNPNWTLNEPRVPGMPLRTGGVYGGDGLDLATSAARAPPGVGMWYLPEKNVREQAVNLHIK